MPYITEAKRKKYQNAISEIVHNLNIENGAIQGFYPVGDLNYIISEIINQTIQRQGLRYQNVNAVVGALECCKLEMYRRLIAPYEDEKIESNGDVY